MHYARQDLLWLKYHLKIEPKIFSVQNYARKLLGQHQTYAGYKDLVKDLCGKDISKKEQQSDWGDPNFQKNRSTMLHKTHNIYSKLRIN